MLSLSEVCRDDTSCMGATAGSPSSASAALQVCASVLSRRSRDSRRQLHRRATACEGRVSSCSQRSFVLCKAVAVCAKSAIVAVVALARRVVAVCRCGRRRAARVLAVLPLHPEQLGRRRREAVVAERLRARGPDHRARRRGRLPGRAAARRHALRLLALAVPRPQGAAGDDPAGQDRLRLRPRRRAAAAEPDAGPRRRRATTSRTPARSSWAYADEDGNALRGQRGRQRAILREGVYAINPAAVRRDHRGRRVRAAVDPVAAGAARRSSSWQQRAGRDRRLRPGRRSAARSSRSTRTTRSSRRWSTRSAS